LIFGRVPLDGPLETEAVSMLAPPTSGGVEAARRGQAGGRGKGRGNGRGRALSLMDRTRHSRLGLVQRTLQPVYMYI
jgi:hypothetical protein